MRGTLWAIALPGFTMSDSKLIQSVETSVRSLTSILGMLAIGQDTAINALIVQHLEKVAITARLLCAKLPPWIEWQELADVGVLAMVEAAPRYREEDGPFWTFVYQRVRGAMLNSLQSKYVPCETPSIPEPYIKIDISRAIARLTCQERTVVLGFGEGRLGREIARRLGISEARVSQIRKTARARLRAAI